MSASAAPRRSEYQAPHIPRLSYRKAAAPGEVPTWEERRGTCVASPVSAPVSPVVAQDGFSTPGDSVSYSQQNMKIESTPLQQKRKSSLFSGFFSKEPTQVALNQVAAQLVAQHGSTSATRVPHVSMEKMPGHVPKVNTKWDGLPESARAVDKRERDLAKLSSRNSIIGRGRSGSVDWDADDASRCVRDSSRISRRTERSNSSSHHEHPVISKHSHPRTSNEFYTNQSKTERSSTSEVSALLRGLNVYLDGSQSDIYLPSSSASNLPEITAFFEGDIPIAQSIPTPLKKEGTSPHRNSDPSFTVTDEAQEKTSARNSPLMGVGPEQDTSPTQSSRGGSPATPSPIHEAGFQVYDRVDLTQRGSESGESSILSVLEPKLKPSGKGRGFLAGEAKPLEIPDDTPIPVVTNLPLQERPPLTPSLSVGPSPTVPQVKSQAPSSANQNRRGHRNLRVKPEVAPWEYVGSSSNTRPSPRSPDPSSPNPNSPSMLSRSLSRLVKSKNP